MKEQACDVEQAGSKNEDLAQKEYQISYIWAKPKISWPKWLGRVQANLSNFLVRLTPKKILTTRAYLH